MTPKLKETMTRSQDSDLLSAIAHQRDAQAFTEFFKRYQKQAYNLAFHLTRKADLAEEAVQESMMRIWTGAATFRSEGSARSWILRIVANKCFGLLRKKMNQEVRSEETDEVNVDPKTTDGEERIAQGELTAALRNAVGALSVKDRCMVALYYTGEMSQDEIAKNLSIPARTVSFRIQKALEFLRARMAKAGYAAGGITGSLMVNAFCEGQPLPAGFSSRILENTLHLEAPFYRASDAQPSSLPKLGATGGRVRAAGLAGIVVLTLAFGVWSSRAPEPDPTPKPASTSLKSAVEPESTSPTAHVPSRKAEQQEFKFDWVFKTGPAPELKVIIGAWNFIKHPSSDAAGMACPPGKRGPVIRLPVRIPEGPCLVYFVGGIHDTAHRSTMLVNAGDENSFTAHRQWGRHLALRNAPKHLSLIHGNHIISLTNKRVHTIKQYEQPLAGKLIYVYLQNFVIARLGLETISEDKLPAYVKNLEATKKSIEEKAKTNLGKKPAEYVKDTPDEPFPKMLLNP